MTNAVVSAEANPSPLLVVAGVHDEKSLGWSACEAWLDRAPDHELLVTVRSDKARAFVTKQSEARPGRVNYLSVDWAEPDAGDELKTVLARHLGPERVIRGIVHAVASADPSSFKVPADQLDPKIYDDAISVSATSLLRLIQGCRAHMQEGAGIVTFGFGENDQVVEGYGGPMSVAKAALRHLVAVQARPLGQAEPYARIAEIVPGYIPTHAGSAVALLQPVISSPRKVANMFEATSPLKNASVEAQRSAAGQLAVSFMLDPMWDQTTGRRIYVDAGRSLGGPSLIPEKAPR